MAVPDELALEFDGSEDREGARRSEGPMLVSVPLGERSPEVEEVARSVRVPPLAMSPDLTGGPLVIEVPAGSRHDSLYARATKRAFDVVIASVALVLAVPVLLAAAVAVRFTMGGPVLFRQVRLGRDGQPFEVLKFRTMKPDRRRAGSPEGWRGEDRRKTHKTPVHPLLTPVGRFLRRYSIDELPQLINVLRGEMSIVGPRPELPLVAARCESWQWARLLVRPGLTGLWQVTARGQGPMHERTDLDVEYVTTMGLRIDLRILLTTPRAIVATNQGY
jgi:lipopolysaccharide/colanic/teichoic acid biosynthesis glycosyltransferase